VPEEGSQPVPPAYPPVSGPQGQAAGYSGAGYQTPPQTAQPAYTTPGTSGPTQSYQQPPAPPASAEDSVWGTEGPPWEQRQPAAPPTGQPQPEPTTPPSQRRSLRVQSSGQPQKAISRRISPRGSGRWLPRHEAARTRSTK
jgi:hypothetical protein